MKVTLNIKKSVAQNAQDYFEQAKKSRKKLSGAKIALEEARALLLKEQQRRDEVIERASQPKKEIRKKEWFEKFRWFITSKGHLAIGGRDATTNEIIIKKHMEPTDLVFHTDMAGSPFFLLKLKGDLASEEEIEEVASATITFSRAWRMGLTTTNVFWVLPPQVSKEANSGEYMAKGSFMIRGKTTYVRALAECSLAQVEGKIMAGPESALRVHSQTIVKVKQGRRSAGDVAKSIQKKIGGDLDDIIRALPSGGVDLD